MSSEELYTLISRKLSGEACPEELEKLELHLRSDPGNQYLMDLLSNYWNYGKEPEKAGAEILSDNHFKHILQLADEPAIKQERRHIPVLRWTGWAAAIAVIGIVSYLLYPAAKAPAPASSNEIMADRGVRSRIVLPDGSQVWLNSGSRIWYNKSFNDTSREIRLEGEAYFDVIKDPRRPFIVSTSKIDIRVLGTSFNIKSYEQEPTIEATLIKGSIEVVNKTAPTASRVILHPYEKLVFNKKEDLFTEPAIPSSGQARSGKSAVSIISLPAHKADSAIKETSWIYNRLDFEGDSFGELAFKMERWYNISIHFEDESLAQSRLRGSFTNETLEEALQALKIITPFTYKIKNNEVTISKK